MTRIGLFEAKTHLSALVDRAAGGETIEITRHGTPVARLCPLESTRSESIAAAAARIRERRKGLRLRGLSLRKLIEEGRA